jgi:hypothetical protein
MEKGESFKVSYNYGTKVRVRILGNQNCEIYYIFNFHFG